MQSSEDSFGKGKLSHNIPLNTGIVVVMMGQFSTILIFDYINEYYDHFNALFSSTTGVRLGRFN